MPDMHRVGNHPIVPERWGQMGGGMREEARGVQWPQLRGFPCRLQQSVTAWLLFSLALQ